MDDILISGQNLCKYYREPALDNVSFEVRKGNIFGLVGKNGAGKTTLIRIAAGQVLAASGELSLFGEHRPGGLERARHRMGCMIETPSFFPYLTAEENLECYRIQRGIQDKGCVKQALQQVGLVAVGRKKFKEFSLGMKQRLGLALAILGKPELLLLDEPINGLDPMGIVEFREILLKLKSGTGRYNFDFQPHFKRIVEFGYSLRLSGKGKALGTGFRPGNPKPLSGLFGGPGYGYRYGCGSVRTDKNSGF